MLHRSVGCTCTTGAMPVGLRMTLLSMQPDSADLPREILQACRLFSDMAEVELHRDEAGERCPVDNDPRRPRVPAVAQVPLEPEENVVAAPRAVVALVAERQAEPGRMLAAV